MPVLATKTSEILKELDDLRSKRKKVDTFTLQRLQKEAEKLLQVNAFHAYQILGAIASFRNKKDEVQANYEKALKLAPADEDRAITLNNYATSIGIMGYFSEAVTLSLKASNFSSSFQFIEQSINKLIKVGLFHRAAELISQLDSFDSTLSTLILRAMQFMDRHSVSDEELQQVIEVTISVLQARQIFDFYQPVIQMEFVTDEESEWFHYSIEVGCSVDEIVEMEYELACQLAELELPLELALYFVTGYEIAEEYDDGA